VYVDLDDARSYARWAGKRLPTEEEWQYAAAGPESLTFPWGNEKKPGCCNAGETGGTTAVTEFPNGRSPFGCYDMCGNTWEWTESERDDGRTRFCIVKGGSWFKAVGSGWYADGGPQPALHAAKFLLTWPGLDRCATIGFRCAVDLAGSTRSSDGGTR
jgi:formylglycine-generating enzyme required for sulfatase activity